ncbi:MAG: TonB-dependent receptor [Bacteroidales bacterium]|nr:TonB-dependent receptor [Bacteroidales bacterium]
MNSTVLLRLIFIVLILVNIFYIKATPDNTDTEKTRYTLSGFIKDENGEDLIGATVYIKNIKTGTVTNLYGFYSVTLLPGEYEIIYSYVGYETQIKKIKLDKNQKINISLILGTSEIESVEITAERKNENVSKISMSNVKLEMKAVKKIPAFLGEVDIIKSIQMLPGVQTGGEGSTGFYVRGGSVDQNLILLDGAPVYNPSHSGGLFSVFNGDAINDAELIKGGIPAQYGGRLSSVLDVRMKEGNLSQFKGRGGIGLISSRLTLEGPIVKDLSAGQAGKSSFIISGRRTYADLVLLFTKDEMAKKSDLFFYDLNAKINYKINDNNRIFISAYSGKDVMDFDTLLTSFYGNKTSTIRWNHIFNNKIFSNFTLFASDFSYGFGMSMDALAFDWMAHVVNYGLKNDYTLFLNPYNTIKFGIQSTFIDFKPGEAKNFDNSFFNIPSLPDNYALEHGIYLQNEQKVSEYLSIQYGMRYSIFQNIGKATIYNFYKEINPFDSSKVYIPLDSTIYKSGEMFNTYTGWEPRFGLRFKVNDQNSVKISYNRTYQYIHLASNTASVTPIDMWFPSNPNILPQKADQIAVGYFRNFMENTIELSIEAYYKKIYDAIDFKDHAVLFLNKYFDGEIRPGEAYSKGIEFLAKKETGQLTGWISYTLSETKRKIPDVNSGEEFYAPYDKTHDIAVILSYDYNERLNFSTNWVYSTAMPSTVPVGKMKYNNEPVPIWSDKNSVRIPGTDYHRLDFSVTFYGRKYKKNGEPKKYNDNWNLSIYNVYSRKNTYSVNFKQNPDNTDIIEAKKLYLFKILPSITYNFNF